MTHKKQTVQANGKDAIRRSDGVGDVHTHGRQGAGESGGGAYPNPHDSTHAKDKFGSFLGHGGQSEPGYFGGGQKGGKKADPGKKGRVGQGG